MKNKTKNLQFNKGEGDAVWIIVVLIIIIVILYWWSTHTPSVTYTRTVQTAPTGVNVNLPSSSSSMTETTTTTTTNNSSTTGSY